MTQYEKKSILIAKAKTHLEIIKNRLIKLANDKDSLIRAEAIEILADFYDGDIDRQILKALNDKNNLVKINALDAIKLPNNTSVVLEKISLFLKSRNWLIKAYAIEALGRNHALQYKKDIENILKKTQNDELKVRIYYALIEFGEMQYLDKLLKLLNNDFYRVRIATSNILYYLVDKNNVIGILEHLNKRFDIELEHSVKETLRGTIKDIENLFSTRDNGIL
ncbi:conserved hypothetical protein [sediment metagenome]|uniref:HEAT repeat domain-containing protein n=1 Tax=sediment metagenome TaxID=749907 RepID=D9PNC9_9ZZZZ